LAILPIRMAGDPVLRQKAKKVGSIDASIQKLIDDMIDTMRDAPGVGLAANQVGVGLRVIVIEVPEHDEEDRELGNRPEGWELLVLINPQIVKRAGERRLDEGCLSIRRTTTSWLRHWSTRSTTLTACCTSITWQAWTSCRSWKRRQRSGAHRDFGTAPR
jgi:peptide deformylase